MNKINKLQHQVIRILENELPDYLTYHNIPHTLYVLEACRIIAKHENISDDDLHLLEVAALMHDVGHIHTSNQHELESCKISAELLPSYGYTKEQLEKIYGMIMATEIPQKPNNLLEEILADADLEYLGTDNFKKIAHRLYLELKHTNPNLTLKDWNNLQIKFISQHKYFTSYCKANNEPLKLVHLQELIDNEKKLESSEQT